MLLEYQERMLVGIKTLLSSRCARVRVVARLLQPAVQSIGYHKLTMFLNCWSVQFGTIDAKCYTITWTAVLHLIEI